METVKEAKPSADRLSWLSPMFGAQHDRFFKANWRRQNSWGWNAHDFTCGVDNVSSDVQFELADLQSDSLLAEHFK